MYVTSGACMQHDNRCMYVCVCVSLQVNGSVLAECYKISRPAAAEEGGSALRDPESITFIKVKDTCITHTMMACAHAVLVAPSTLYADMTFAGSNMHSCTPHTIPIKGP